ncbi:MAG: 50S ribosomal protein L10 [Pseudomonadales bacterium]|nr:50S ribosomal protein L10 [Pseudomonadales bacterium]
MTLKLDDKKQIVAEVSQAASAALSAVLADYRGLTVGQMTKLRAQAREQGVFIRVVRNTLARRAMQGTDFECLHDDLVGPTIIALSLNDPGAAARLFKAFAKDNQRLEVKALAVGGRKYGAKDIDVLATLPTRDQALSMLLGLMQAPVTNFARTLNEIPTKFVRALAQVKDQKAA